MRSSRAENVPAVPVAETLFSHCRALGFGLWFELDPTAAAELRDPRAATENEDPTAAAQSRRSQINAYFEREAAEVDSAPGSPTLRPEPLPPLRSSEAAATRAEARCSIASLLCTSSSISQWRERSGSAGRDTAPVLSSTGVNWRQFCPPGTFGSDSESASQMNHFYNFQSFHSYDLHLVLTEWIEELLLCFCRRGCGVNSALQLFWKLVMQKEQQPAKLV